MTETENVLAITRQLQRAPGVLRFLWYLVRMRGEHRAMVRALAEQLVKVERGQIPWETSKSLKPNTLAR